MNLQAKKLELVQLILNTDRPGLLDRVSQLLKLEEETDWREGLPASVQQSIEKGNREADKGETLSHEEVMREVRSKYGL